MGDRLFRSRGVLALFTVLGIVALLQLVGAGASEIDGRAAPDGSSYSTNDPGHKALRRLLEIGGYEVAVLRTPVADVPPPDGSTVFVIGGAPLSAQDQDALHDLVVDGGRLVAAETSVERVLGEAPSVVPSATATHALAFPYPGSAEIASVAAPAGHVFSQSGPLVPVLGDPDAPAVGVVAVGAGEVWLLADASILANESLDRADNAALGLLLAGPMDRTVAFVEYVHGYEPFTGFASLPGRWQAALWIAAVAGVVWMLSRGRRLGPPERQTRPLPPPRVAYVDAVATSLGRTGDLVGATEAVRHRIRRELQRRGSDEPDDVARIAAQLGVDREEVDRAMAEPAGADDVLAAGRILARLTQHRM